MCLSSLSYILHRFDEAEWKGSFHKGPYQIANGGYDCWFVIYYNSIPVIECIDGVLKVVNQALGNRVTDVLQKIVWAYPHLTTE